MHLRHAAVFVTAILAPLVAQAQASSVLIYGTDTDRRDQFGSGAALFGDRLVVGAAQADLGLPCEACEPGAAYVFEPGGITPWAQTARLSPVQVPADYREAGAFGSEVDACEAAGPSGLVAYLATGAPAESFGYEATGSPPRDSLRNGAVYVYRQPAGGAWTLDRKFRDPAPRTQGNIGSGITLICEGPDVTVVSTGDVGQFVSWHRDGQTGIWAAGTSMSGAQGSYSPFDFRYWIDGTAGGPNGERPAVLDIRRVFRRSGSGGSPWMIETTLPRPSEVASDNNYQPVAGAIDGDWVVMSYLNSSAPYTNGRAYVFHYTGAGSGWVQDAVFANTSARTRFGSGSQVVAMPDGTVLVGVQVGDPPAVKLFSRSLDGVWSEVAQIAGFPPGNWVLRDMTSRRLVLADAINSTRGAEAGAVLVVDLTGVVADEPTAPAAEASVRVWPNPAAGAFQVAARVPGGGAVRVVAYDGLGRRVAVLGEATVGEGTALVVRVPGGRLAAGVYVVRAEGAGGVSAAARLVVVR